MRAFSLALAIFTSLVAGAQTGNRAQPAAGAAPGDDGHVIKDFGARVDDYMALHKKQAVSLKSTDSPQKLADARHNLKARLRTARAGARQGDVFTAPVAAYFRRQIAATLHGADGAKIRASLKHAEPVKAIPLHVNDRYPRNVPLQSTPPTLLMNLPRLPQELQYRIVGRDLVLYDVAADMVVDFISGAVPASQAS
jgi:hypothetical protein